MDVDREQYYDDGGGGSRRNRNRGGGGDRHHPYGGDEGHRGGDRRGGGGRGGGRGDRRGDRRGRGPRDDGALSFRDFCYKYLRDDTTPAEAERRYEEYQKENAEAFYERYFRDHRHDEGERARNDPRVLVETLKRRDDVSVARALEFFDARANGSLVIYTEDGGADDGDHADGDAEMNDGNEGQQPQQKKRSVAPIEAWHPIRLGFDYKQTGKLIAAVDAEKGVEQNPLLDGDEGAGMDVGDGNGEEDAAALEALGNEESTAEKLDERLCYLMRVHGIDYYRRCQEMNPVTFLERVTMTSAFSKRDPKPETPVATIAENPYGVRWSASLDANVKRRIAEGDPQVKKLATSEIEAKLEEWIKSCVVKHDEQRFGCTLSTKLFVAEEFVIKHIRTKQAHHVEDMHERLLDEQYKKNVVEFLKYEENRKASRKGRKKFGGIMMMQVTGAGPEGGFVQVPVATAGGAKMIQGMQRYTDLDAATPPETRVVIDYGDI